MPKEFIMDLICRDEGPGRSGTKHYFPAILLLWDIFEKCSELCLSNDSIMYEILTQGKNYTLLYARFLLQESCVPRSLFPPSWRNTGLNCWIHKRGTFSLGDESPYTLLGPCSGMLLVSLGCLCSPMTAIVRRLLRKMVTNLWCWPMTRFKCFRFLPHPLKLQ